MTENVIDPLFNYLLTSWKTLTQQSPDLTQPDTIEKAAEKWQFAMRLLQEAYAPDNFPQTNPTISAKIMETGGISLLEGFKQYLDDIIKGNGRPHIPLTDENAFIIGKDIACTPGDVIFQNDVIQLIHYHPTTEKIHAHPLLIIPPWINKYYILDLQPHNSMVRWLVEQGISVFMISWINPSNKQREKTFSDYLFEGPIAAINAIQKMTGKKHLNTLGYCIGGTLQSCLLAYLAKKKNTCIKSATFFTTLLDFSEPGDLGFFVDHQQFEILKNHMSLKGYLEGSILSALFTLLRAKDLLWPAYVKQYLTHEKPKPSDFLFWNADSTNISEKVHAFYLEQMYLKNALTQPDVLQFENVPIDLANIKTPCWFTACERDHIVPWKSCYKSRLLIQSPVQFTLSSAGHVAGIVTPPSQTKYSYHTSDKIFDTPNTFISETESVQGSWWPAWFTWLKQYSGKLVAEYDQKLPVIESAPGSYVKQKCS